MAQADGQEVVVVEGDAGTRAGLERLFKKAGLAPTAVEDGERAIELLQNRFYPVVVADLDTPTEGAGVALIARIKQVAPSTAVVILSGRRNFEAAAEAFRGGADDAFFKAPDQINLLEQKVIELALRGGGHTQEMLAEESLKLFDELLRKLMEAHKRTVDLEAKLTGVLPVVDDDVAVLLVEHDGWLAQELGTALQGRSEFTMRHASSGGEGLDASTAGRFQLALVSDSLPDLPGSMVVSALKQQAPDTIVILYSRPGRKPGKAEILEGSKAIVVVPELTSATQLIAQMETLREAYVAKSRERQYLVEFRQQHFELLKRLASLKQKIQSR